MRKLLPLLLCLLLIGCATTSKVAQNITLDMSTDEVLRKSGKPFSKNAFKDSVGNVIEEWVYRETTWDGVFLRV